MATMLLGAAGGAIGGVLGGPVGLLLGKVIGSAAGTLVDSALFSKNRQGPRLNSMPSLTSNEGANIPRLYGKARLGADDLGHPLSRNLNAIQRWQGWPYHDNL